jgi:predicted esterase
MIRAIITSLFIVATVTRCAVAEDRPIVANVRAFLQSNDAAMRARLVTAIQSDPDFRPEKLSELLHSAHIPPPVRKGLSSITIPVADGDKRTISLRVPQRYDHKNSWPVILAYHPTGGNGPDMIRAVAGVLDESANDFIIAAPTNYLPLNVDSKRAWTDEVRMMLREMRRTLSIDSDRIYVTGFSQGGYAAWSFATFFADEIAAAIPVACAFDAAPEIPGLWEMLLPNSDNVQILHVWGERDTLQVLGIDIKTPQGTNTELNRKLRGITKSNVTNHEIPGGGHSYNPPKDMLLRALESRRIQSPKKIHHHFRYLSQSRANWIEPLSWEGDRWGVQPKQFDQRENESREAAIARMIDDSLGLIDAEIAGQQIRIQAKKISQFILWFDEGMIDFDKPVAIIFNGKTVFADTIERNLGVCLNDARRTLDFDRLRWAGLRIDHDGETELMTVDDDELAPIIHERQ